MLGVSLQPPSLPGLPRRHRVEASDARSDSIVSVPPRDRERDRDPGTHTPADPYMPHISCTTHGPGRRRRRLTTTTTTVAEEEHGPPTPPRRRPPRNPLENGDREAYDPYTAAGVATAARLAHAPPDFGGDMTAEEMDSYEERVQRAWKSSPLPRWHELVREYGPPGAQARCWGCRRILHGNYAWDMYTKLHEEFVNAYLRHNAPIPAAEKTHERFRQMLDSTDESAGASGAAACGPAAHRGRGAELAPHAADAPLEWPVIDIINHFFFHNPSSDCRRLLYMWASAQVDEWFVTDGLMQVNELTGALQVNGKQLANFHRHAAASIALYSKRELTHKINTQAPSVEPVPKPKRTHTVPHLGFKGLSV